MVRLSFGSGFDLRFRSDVDGLGARPNAELALTIGNPAPELDVEHWVQTGGGQFKPVTKFESGKVYVVEFWATWCGPCIASMPHINQLQKDYRDRGVQVVSISDEDLETVTKFLEKEARTPSRSKANEGNETDKDAPKTTYADVTKDYCLTTDPDGSCEQAYMRAAGQNGIPTAFLVGKSGRIEWIGHPMSIDEPLKAVVEDAWDRDAFAVKFKAEQEQQKILRLVTTKLRAQDPEGAIEVLDNAMKDASPELRDRLIGFKFRVLMTTGDEEKAAPIADELLKKAGDNSGEVNNTAWMIYQYASSKNKPESPLVQVALKAAAEAAPKATGSGKAYLYDTLAHLQHLVGKLDEALASQKIAAASDGAAETPEIGEFLKQLESEKAGK